MGKLMAGLPVRAAMAHVKLFDESSAPSEARQTLQGLKEDTGALPSAYAVFAASPEVLNTLMPFHQTVMTGTDNVDGKTRQAIALAVSAVNECRYCIVAHSGGMKKEGASDDEVEAVKEMCVEDPRLSTILELATQITKDANDVSPDLLERLRGFGLTDGDLVDVVTVASHFNFFNRVLDALGVSPPSG